MDYQDKMLNPFLFEDEGVDIPEEEEPKEEEEEEGEETEEESFE